MTTYWSILEKVPGKERWRTFINSYEGKVDDYNFGTMLRANAAEEYGQEGTIFGRPRG
jgi:hypothetical protein